MSEQEQTSQGSSPEGSSPQNALKRPGLLIVLCLILIGVYFVLSKVTQDYEAESDQQMSEANQKVGRHHKPLQPKPPVSAKIPAKS